MRITRPGRARGAWCAVVLALALAACGRDPGDPAAITRAFIRAVMAAESEEVRALTCAEWQATTVRWADEGTPGLHVDTDHLVLDIGERRGPLVEVRVTGTLALRAPDGRREVRSLDGNSTLLFALIDEDGWKICGVTGTLPG